ncbi:MAG: AAA family ATPase, partial [Actinobacteria bacterium]|nr:AAA family ATPase [Actinomycetota bacterium]
MGREAELAVALDVVDRVAAATGQALVIEGEAGIGKTRMVDELLRTVRQRGWQLVRGAARPLETEMAFAPWVDALGLHPDAPEERRAAIARLMLGDPDSPGSAGPEMGTGTSRQAQLVQAIIDVIVDRCDAGPVVLALEDVHWIDGPSLAVVDRLARRLAHLPLLVILSARPYPRSPELHGVLDRLTTSGAGHLPLAGLPDGATARLAAAVLRQEPGPTVLAALNAAAGNPLFVAELLAALREDGAFEPRDGVVELHTARLPPSLRLTLLRRLSVLPEDTVELLRLAAVLGTAFAPDALAVVARRPEVDVVRDLEPARRAGLLDSGDHGLTFHHDLIRDAVYEDLPGAARQVLHGAAAQALADAGYPPEVTAPHLLRGTLEADERTLTDLRAVASALGVRAPDLAVQLLERAVELADRGSRDELRVELARAMGWAHRPRDAAALADELLERLDRGPLRRTALLIRVSQAQFLGGFERYGERLEAAATEPDASPGERARLLALATAACVDGGDPERAEAVGRRATDAARHAADDIALCAALVSMAVAALASMDDGHGRHVPAEAGGLAISRAREAVDVARRSDDPELPLVVAPAVTLAMTLGTFPQHRGEAIELSQGGLVDAEQRGLPAFAATYHMTLGVNLYRAGRWDEATTELESAVERCLELDTTGPLVDISCRLARIAVRRDDLAGAERWIARAEAAQGPAPSTAYAVFAVLARATLLEAT